MNNLAIHHLLTVVAPQNPAIDPVELVRGYLNRLGYCYQRPTAERVVAEVVAMARVNPEWFTKGDEDENICSIL